VVMIKTDVLKKTNGQNTKHLVKLYITDKHEHLEQGHMSDTYMDCHVRLKSANKMITEEPLNP